MNKVFIIAEAGVNHNGSLELAIKLCDEAKRIGADAVKFQTFKTEKLVSKNTILANYQKKNLQDCQSQFEMIKALELSYDEFIRLKNHCYFIGIEFMSTPDEEDSLQFLVDLGVKKLKIGSGEVDNVPFLRRVAKHNLPTIFSTGMSTMEEVAFMVETLLKAGLEKRNITLLHCNTEYPTPFHDVNLQAMISIKDKFDIQVGYSDHTLGTTVPIAATAMGAVCIEKHFTLDKNLPGPDHNASLNVREFEDMIKAVRDTEIILGSKVKSISPSESKNKKLIRKVIVAGKTIKRGQILTEEYLYLKRANGVLTGSQWDQVLGKVADKDYEIDEGISEDLLK